MPSVHIGGCGPLCLVAEFVCIQLQLLSAVNIRMLQIILLLGSGCFTRTMELMKTSSLKVKTIYLLMLHQYRSRKHR